MLKGLEQKPSRTAGGASLYRTIINIEFHNSRFGPDYLAKYFLPLYQRYILRIKVFRNYRKRKFIKGVKELHIARTQYFDNLFTDALHKGIPQIVMMGAGYDTRAYRFAEQNTNTRIFEMDVAATQGRKIECLKKAKIKIPENLVFIPVNFDRESLYDVLMKNGFNRQKAALFLLEGLIYYLEPESVDALLESVNKITHGRSCIAFDYIVLLQQKEVNDDKNLSKSRDLMIKRYPAERNKCFIEESKIDAFLKQRGFKMTEHLNVHEIEMRYLYDNNGLLIGNMINIFRFVQAESIMNNQHK